MLLHFTYPQTGQHTLGVFMLLHTLWDKLLRLLVFFVLCLQSDGLLHL